MNGKIRAGLLTIVAGCATAGGTEFRTSGQGMVSGAIECVEDVFEDDGYQITDRNDALLYAQRGSDTVQATFSGGQGNTYGIYITTSDTDTARETAQDIIVECGA